MAKEQKVPGFIPGPWDTYEEGDCWGIEAREGGIYASIVVFGYEEDECGVKGEDREQMEANARLIASAPDLYQALKFARRFVKEGSPDAEYIDSVLNKAILG